MWIANSTNCGFAHLLARKVSFQVVFVCSFVQALDVCRTLLLLTCRIFVIQSVENLCSSEVKNLN